MGVMLTGSALLAGGPRQPASESLQVHTEGGTTYIVGGAISPAYIETGPVEEMQDAEDDEAYYASQGSVANHDWEIKVNADNLSAAES